jgi:hypothetical protein
MIGLFCFWGMAIFLYFGHRFENAAAVIRDQVTNPTALEYLNFW